jgi:hypothetical protein
MLDRLMRAPLALPVPLACAAFAQTPIAYRVGSKISNVLEMRRAGGCPQLR